ncbi:MAG: methylenetetrahydrofolate reductase C-terminal domain-containing protein [Candidatus Omnitrophica bacterium]|nr:methylenetetrahydrofolate reductase C-terminal domain-containing protein [Candidatus Omnitrophota bacterium]
MIISKQKPFEEILKILSPYSKIFIVGCGTCSTTCKSGGEEEVAKIKPALEKAGKLITGTVVSESPCVAAQVKVPFAKNRKAIEEADAMLVLSCGSGVQSVKENDRWDKPVLPGCDTLFAATVNAKGEFNEYCSHCGECVLDITGGICPVTRCAKGLLNGPCGGMDKGKCEVDKDQDCAWVLIYKEAEKHKNLGKFRQIQDPKDHSQSIKPHKLKLEQ